MYSMHMKWLVWLFFCTPLWSQQYFTISGYMRDSSSDERLVYAHIYEKRSQVGTTTNGFGFYSITLPAGKVHLEYSYIGYLPEERTFTLRRDTQIDIWLTNSAVLKEVEVRAKRIDDIVEKPQMSEINVPVHIVNSLPAFLGEVDVLRAVQLLPGVIGGNELQTGIHVRGGSPDQNLYLIDGVPVYHVSHLLGLFSIFNPDALSRINLIKGAYPARYGGRLSSVLEVYLKDGHAYDHKASGSIGLLSSQLTLNGPIEKGKSTYLISARRTFTDLLFLPIWETINLSSSESKIYPRNHFYDFYFKTNYTLDKRNKLYFSLYSGKDRYGLRIKYIDLSKVSAEYDLSWGNTLFVLRWNYQLNPRVFSNVSATYTTYDLNTFLGFNIAWFSFDSQDRALYEEFTIKYGSGIRDLGLHWDVQYNPHPNHDIRSGVSVIHHRYIPTEIKVKRTWEQGNTSGTTIDTTIGPPRQSSFELNAYVEDDIRWKQFRFNTGMRFTLYNVPNKWYYSVEPRLSGRLLLPRKWSLKLSYAQTTQYINLLTSGAYSLPTDIWVPSTARIRPQRAWQVAAGVAKIWQRTYEFSIEAYYKRMKNILDYVPGLSYGDDIFVDWQKIVMQGNGESYGLELFLQKKYGDLTGWMSYTLAWNYRQFDQINGGRPFPYDFDRRHDFTILLNYKLSKRWAITSSWFYGTGYPITLPKHKFSIFSPIVHEYTLSPFVLMVTPESINNFRLPAHHRLDLSIQYLWQRKWWTHKFILGVINAYIHPNPVYLTSDIDFAGFDNQGNPIYDIQYTQISLLPLVPFFTYQFEF